VAGSRRGKRLGHTGMAGFIAFWESYRDRCDRLVQRLPFAPLTLDVSARDWSAYLTLVARFLDLPSPADLERYAGSYPPGRVALEEGGLVAYGIPRVWERARLVRHHGPTFDVASLPYQASFVADRAGAVRELRLTGRAPMRKPGDSVDGTFARA